MTSFFEIVYRLETDRYIGPPKGVARGWAQEASNPIEMLPRTDKN